MSIPSNISNALSANTNNALSLITDPYHDYNLKAVGYPDGSTTISAVKRFSSRTTIRCPFALESGDTWYFHVFTTPLHKVNNVFQHSIIGNYMSLGQVTNLDLGPVNIWYYHVRSGNVIAYTSSALGVVNTTDTATASSTQRTVSLGFEIHNITAELFKQGSLTVYRAPYIDSSVDVFLKTETMDQAVPYHTNNIVNFPTSLAEAELLPNTRTWEAADGAYCVSLPHPDNRFSNSVHSNFIIGASSVDTFYGMQPGQAIRAPVPTYSALSCTGVMSSHFSDAQQAFTLDMRQVLEINPSPKDTVNMQYATSSADRDAKFLKLYKNMFNSIPPGTPVGNNASGDWFRSIIRIAKNVLPSVLASIPHPAAQTAAVATRMIFKQLEGSKQTAKPKQQQSTPPSRQAKLKNPTALRKQLATIKAGNKIIITPRKTKIRR